VFKRDYDSLGARGIAESFIERLREVEESSPDGCAVLIETWSADHRLAAIVTLVQRTKQLAGAKPAEWRNLRGELIQIFSGRQSLAVPLFHSAKWPLPKEMTAEAAHFAEVVVRELQAIRSSQEAFAAVVASWQGNARLKEIAQLAQEISIWPPLLHPRANLEDFGADIDRANWYCFKETLKTSFLGDRPFVRELFTAANWPLPKRPTSESDCFADAAIEELQGQHAIAGGCECALGKWRGDSKLSIVVALVEKAHKNAIPAPGWKPNSQCPLGDQIDQGAWNKLREKLAEVFAGRRELAVRLFHKAGWPSPLAGWDEVQAAELKEIHALRKQRGLTRDPGDENALLGLAFSGGGIRSATFNLGVLEGLANYDLIREIDILSTVSGGGYIGAWLAAWIKRDKSLQSVEQSLALAGTIAENKEEKAQKVSAMRATMRASTPRPSDQKEEPASSTVPPNLVAFQKEDLFPKPIRFLREFSNYLTPRTGFFSIDTWTAIAVYVRNVTLNQVILAALIGALMLLPRFAVKLFQPSPVESTIAAGSEWLSLWLIGVALALMIYSVAVISINLWRVTADPGKNEPAPADANSSAQLNSLGAQGVNWNCVATMILGVACASVWFWKNINNNALRGFELNWFWLLAGLGFIIFSGFITFCSRSFDCVNAQFRNPILRLGANVLLFVAMLVSSGFALVLLRGYLSLISSFRGLYSSGPWHAVVWSPLLLMMVISVAAILHVGLLGIYTRDVGREWLTRFHATTNLWIFFWCALCCAEIYGPLLIENTVLWLSPWLSGALGFGWIATVITALRAGQSADTRGNPDAKKNVSVLEILAKIGPPVFIVGFFLLVALAENWLLTYAKLNGNPFNVVNVQTLAIRHWEWLYPSPLWGLTPTTPVGLIGLLLVAGFILAWRVDINEFSMNHFYKNRLVRCYLGASNRKRRANPFTGFNPGDDFSICELQAAKGYQGPYHLINATLNLSSGEDLAWQERKGASFIFTPLYCGFDYSLERLGHVAKARGDMLPAYAYRSSKNYGYPEGVSLGTAVAISGAAANPNQGDSTSPTVAFLMTLFDVRLGWWLGNPRNDHAAKRAGPAFGLPALLSELLGNANDQTSFVSLSDGGKFDNLGLYELVRRRCQYIILCDAEEDGDYSFEGLGTAIRKCRIDFGVNIEIDPRATIPAGTPKRSQAHCAVGTIHYNQGEPGTLLYIKSTLSGDEPKDVLQYASTDATFPQQSTFNQWFTESQFESYRALGYQSVKAAMEPATIWSWQKAEEPAVQKTLTLGKRFRALRDAWYPENPGVRQHALKHTATLSRLFSQVAEDDALRGLGDELFSLTKEFGHNRSHRREEFYFVMSLLQLVEDIYFDFQLDKSEWWDDPRIKGWRTFFTHWAKASAVDEVWHLKKDTFRQDFQKFWERCKQEGMPGGKALGAHGGDV
jgi:hypothetical protein